MSAVRWWQADPTKTALTCAHDSGHQPLDPIDEKTQVVLRCRDCGYRTEIPPLVLRAYYQWVVRAINWLAVASTSEPWVFG